MFSYKPRSTLHELLAAKNYSHINSGIIKDISPIFHHPYASILMNEVILKIENVRVVGMDFDAHFDQEFNSKLFLLPKKIIIDFCVDLFFGVCFHYTILCF